MNLPISLHHLLAAGTAIALTATGKVTIGNIIFVLFSLIYTYFLSKTAFPLLPPPKNPKPNSKNPVINVGNTLFRIYFILSIIIGTLLPALYIIDDILRRENALGVNSPAVCHLFLLCSQVFMEGLFYSIRFSLPIWVFVPVVNNSARIWILFEWVKFEFSKLDQEYEYEGSLMRLYFGIGLSCANLVFWCYNLFGFLLPVFLPRAFKRYYSSIELVKDS